MRTETASDAAEVSGMAQSIGYLLAACGPILFGILHDFLGSFTFPLILLLIVLFLFFMCGMGAARNKTLFEKIKKSPIGSFYFSSNFCKRN
ncbi:hypothetical protein LFLEISCH_01165 [Listeria fleischmannii subsp. fleischmannii LU2006-1]|nr:hypothetical protein [Listeria fleischmannii]EMG29218.1 hypothetical protein LFLEISCH_01165 [Listeria fleischmannii subsp. fleischmannii LU2006-1]